MHEPPAIGSRDAHPARTFDDQALQYDARAGLPANVCAKVARAIVDLTGAGPGDLVVEIGAGTGEIGSHLARMPIRYVGLDASAPMLRLYQAKAVAAAPSLIRADGDRGWPLRDGVATVVVASRVIHLLNPDNVTRETLRVGRRSGFLLLGRVVRERDSIKERLRRQRQELLAEAGVRPRHGLAGTRLVVEQLQAAGAVSLRRRVVVEWAGETTPETVIGDWESLSRMGSVAIDPQTRAGIIAGVRSWARAELGTLDRPETFRERYAIDVVRLP